MSHWLYCQKCLTSCLVCSPTSLFRTPGNVIYFKNIFAYFPFTSDILPISDLLPQVLLPGVSRLINSEDISLAITNKIHQEYAKVEELKPCGCPRRKGKMLCFLGWAPWTYVGWGIYETCDCGLVLSEVLKTLVGSYVTGTYSLRQTFSVIPRPLLVSCCWRPGPP